MYDVYNDNLYDPTDPNADIYGWDMPQTPAAPRPSYAWWSDPDNPPPAWMLDPRTPPVRPGGGFYWNWAGDHWEQLASPTAPPPSPNPNIDTPPPGPGGGGGGGLTFTGGVGGGGGTAHSWPSYAPPSFVDPGTFQPGPAFAYQDFAAPSGQDVLKDPGFQFRMDQGRKALESSAAGKGILRSGGTLKDLLSYGQNFASQEYGNVYDRALREYDTNRNNAADIWSKQYGQRRDVFGSGVDRANSLNAFNVNNAQFDQSGRQRQAELDFQDLYNRWAKEGDWLRDLGVAGLE